MSRQKRKSHAKRRGISRGLKRFTLLHSNLHIVAVVFHRGQRLSRKGVTDIAQNQILGTHVFADAYRGRFRIYVFLVAIYVFHRYVATGDSLLNSIVAGVIDAPELALCERSTLTLNQSHIALNNGLLSFYKWTNPPGLNLPPAYVHLNLTLDGLPMDGSHVVLFSGVDKLNLGGTSYTDSYTTTYQFNAQDYFDGAWIGENTILWYENGMVTLSGFVTPMIPEPSTATLSLLALSALASRRRRK